jgi:hypothetical protein
METNLGFDFIYSKLVKNNSPTHKNVVRSHFDVFDRLQVDVRSWKITVADYAHTFCSFQGDDFKILFLDVVAIIRVHTSHHQINHFSRVFFQVCHFFPATIILAHLETT